MKKLLPGWRVALACGLALFSAMAAHAAPARDPVLRIETGGHLATITRISADAAGRWIVTASEDKTARLWDARTGQQAAVLRPPIGSDSIGALYAAAISPDGRTVALGGNSNFGDNTHLLHLFDRASASVPAKSTMAGLEAPLTQLSWSPDNQLIAVGLRQEGLRVFRRNLQFVGADPEYNEAIFGTDFSVDGRLAVASIDGFIRLYRIGKKGLERIARIEAPGGKPYAVAFSPDGRALAVGYQDKARVDLFDTGNLAPIHRIDMGSGNLGRVVWSTDGATLYAAGGYVSNGRFPVLAFGNRGTATAREVGSFSNTILSLAALPGGNIAAASAEPAWAAWDANAQRLSGSQPQSADFRDSGTNFRLSADGSVVSFQFRAGDANHVFDLGNGSLKALPAPDKTVPPVQGGAPNVEQWKNSTTPRANGRALALKAGEVSRSLAIQPADRSFVLGTEWFVRRYSQEGNPLWERRVSAPAWAVNLSSDGRWVVAGLGDGSIRWFRAQDGAEQLALFAHSDKTRWIAWTPSGYYDTSVGGENLVGWHLNRAFNQSADFFSAGRFRDKLYRPDVIQKLLAAGDEKEAFKLAQAELAEFEAANAEPAPAPMAKSAVRKTATPVPAAALAATPQLVEIIPPIIELQSDSRVEASGDVVNVRYAVRTPTDAPIREIKVRVNGQLDRSIKPSGQRAIQGDIPVQEIKVRIPPGKDSEIVLIAENKNAKSDPVSINVAQKTQPATPVKIEYETLHLLIIGVAKYPGERALVLPTKDASDFNRHMTAQQGKLYGKAQTVVLSDANASRENILKELQALQERVGPKDVGVVFLAGHGHNIGSDYYFIPGDPDTFPAKGEVKSESEFDAWIKTNGPKRWVPGAQIAKTLLNLKGRAVFFVDTCHSGNLTSEARRIPSDATGTLNAIDDEKGVIIFASSTGKEYSQEDEAWGNGAFTKSIIEGLQGGADKDRNGLIRPSYLSAFMKDRVKELTKNEQRPVTFNVGIDDPFAIKTNK